MTRSANETVRLTAVRRLVELTRTVIDSRIDNGRIAARISNFDAVADDTGGRVPGDTAISGIAHRTGIARGNGKISISRMEIDVEHGGRSRSTAPGIPSVSAAPTSCASCRQNDLAVDWTDRQAVNVKPLRRCGRRELVPSGSAVSGLEDSSAADRVAVEVALARPNVKDVWISRI